MSEKKLTIVRDGVPIYTGPSIPPNTIQPGDTVHLGPGHWHPDEIQLGLDIGARLVGSLPKPPTPEELVRRAGEELLRRAETPPGVGHSWSPWDTDDGLECFHCGASIGTACRPVSS